MGARTSTTAAAAGASTFSGLVVSSAEAFDRVARGDICALWGGRGVGRVARGGKCDGRRAPTERSIVTQRS